MLREIGARVFFGGDRASVTILAALVCAVMATGSVSATAATRLSQRAGPQGCVTETGSSGECLDGRGLVGAASVALSPSGANAYVASTSWNSVSILYRDPGAGSLSPVASTAGCFDSLPGLYPDCTPLNHLEGAYDVAVSPDGENVYVAAPAAAAIVVFERNPANGLLKPMECLSQDGSGVCVDGRALAGVTAIEVSPDGANVYVASAGVAGGLAVFDRDLDTGTLTQKGGETGCINETASEDCADGFDQMLELRDVALSSDGKSAYAVSRGRDAVTGFSRNMSSGELTPFPLPAGCVNEGGSSGCQDGTALIRAEAIAVSPDGASLYVAGERSDSIAIFDRNAADGTLAQKAGTAGCISNTGLSNQQQASTAGECQDGAAMDGVDSIVVLPDGSGVYAAARDSAAVDGFERHPDGTLTQLPGVEGCVTETGREDPDLDWTAGHCQDGRALQGISRVISSDDGKHLYTAAENGGVGVFDILDPPRPDVAAVPTPASRSVVASPDRTCKFLLADISRARRRIRAIAKAVHYLSHLRNLTSAQHRRLSKERRARGLWAKRLHRAQRREREQCPTD